MTATTEAADRRLHPHLLRLLPATTTTTHAGEAAEAALRLLPRLLHHRLATTPLPPPQPLLLRAEAGVEMAQPLRAQLLQQVIQYSIACIIPVCTHQHQGLKPSIRMHACELASHFRLLTYLMLLLSKGPPSPDTVHAGIQEMLQPLLLPPLPLVVCCLPLFCLTLCNACHDSEEDFSAGNRAFFMFQAPWGVPHAGRRKLFWGDWNDGTWNGNPWILEDGSAVAAASSIPDPDDIWDDGNSAYVSSSDDGTGSPFGCCGFALPTTMLVG